VNQKRMNERIQVNLPITCTLTDNTTSRNLSGQIDDLSIAGMKISLPLLKMKAKILDFVLELPHPFSRIKGNAEIQWQRWDSAKNRMTCGLKLSPMRIEHLTEIDTIVQEVQADGGKVKHSG